MERTITVKGTGKVTIKPDLTVVSLTLRSLDHDYDASVADAARRLDALRAALGSIGFARDELKTVTFRVSTEQESIRDENGNYKSVFAGYSCIHGLKLEFDFDTDLLSRVLSAVAGCEGDPELYIQFGVRDREAVREALLESAAQNARAKAEVLARASGVALGELLSIRYHWGERDFFSTTEYGMEKRCMSMANGAGMDIMPDDITVDDNAAFVWAIL